ncbi:MAG: hypothetical protein ACOCZ6_02010 [Nanoarchaeota archaeon]
MKMKSKVLIKRDIKISKNKVAGLNISVNAIVVFVLAFAMLGVGIAFINMIREELLGSVGDIVPTEELDNPATSQTPVTVSSDIKVPANGDTRETIGFYNTETSEATDATVGISDCVGTGGLSNLEEDADSENDNSVPGVDSPITTVDPTDGTGFSVVINAPEGAETGTYICTMSIFDSNDGQRTATTSGIEEYEYETETFYLEVTP